MFDNIDLFEVTVLNDDFSYFDQLETEVTARPRIDINNDVTGYITSLNEMLAQHLAK